MKKKYWLIGGLCAAMAACLFTACGMEAEPFDESKFGGSTNDENNELVTDKKIKLDGKLDDACWQNQKAFGFTYQNVDVDVKTVFGELGFYVGFEVKDDHVYAVEGRDVWMGSSVEMYVDRGDATKKSERTFQYRLGALDQWECLYGYETQEDRWSATYLPVFGRTTVHGTVNSGNTEGMTAEIYVRWDALGYDFTNENFEVPETVKIMPVYNQSSGAEMDSNRDFWVNNGGDIGNPMHYWLFDKDGFVDADGADAAVGDSAYGRAKSAGWDVTRESEGIVRSKTAGDQSIFFTNLYATDYAVTTLIEYQDALEYWADNKFWQKDPYPKAGLILASDSTIQAYLLNYDGEHRRGTAEGMFFRKGNPDPRETWELYNPKSLGGVLENGAAGGKLRMTSVKVGRYLLVFLGDADTAKYGGTFVGMQEIPETAGKAAPGFYTLGCEVEFTDYAATTDEGVITGLANSVLSVLKLDQKNGGVLKTEQLGYKKGETAIVTVSTYENYKLTSLKVNGEERIDALTKDGELSVTMSENEMTVTPVYERVDDARLVGGTLHYVEKNAPAKTISMLITGTAAGGGKVFYETKPEAADAQKNAEWYANLPDGTYTAHVLVDGIYRANKEFTVEGENLTLSAIETPLNWIFYGDVETKKNGSQIVRGFNQFREVKDRSATDYFAMSAYLFRDDGNFNTNGTWETGGFGVKVDDTVYRFHAMRYSQDETYFYIEVDGGAKQEYTGISHSYAGTGAPLQMDVFYMNGEFRLLFDGTTSFVINAENTPNKALSALFDTSKTKYLGLVTVGKDMVFQGCDFAFNEADTNKMYHGDYGTTHTVSGSFSYADGLNGAGDSVTVTSRRFVGVASGNSWSIELPDGTHEITFTSSRFRTKTVSVTVNGGNVTVDDSVEFRQIKYENAGVVEYADETSNDIKIVGGDWTASYFAGVTAGTGIRVDANVQRADGKSLQYGDWQTGGLYLGTATKQFVIFVKCLENSTEILFGETTEWGNWWWYTVPEGFGGGTGDALDLSFVYLPGSITIMLGGRTAVTITKDTVGAGENAGSCTPAQYREQFYNEFFASDISAYKVGLRLAQSPSGDKGTFFKNVKYTPVTEIPADMKGSVKLPASVDGLTITAENGKLSGLVGETVTLEFNLDDGKTITALTLGGRDVLSELSAGKLTVTLKAGEAELLVTTEGVSVYAVTGTLGYASGLYSAGDKVTVSSSTFMGTLTGENWSIKLPDGNHEITFASERFESVKVNVTVGGGALSVSDKVEFTTIKFTAESIYERDGNDVLTPASAWTGAYFAGIDGANGIRADAELQREDGNFEISGGWGTGGFMIKKNGVEFLIYVMKGNNGECVVYLQNKSNWTTYEYVNTKVYTQGTGAPIELSLVYLGDELHLLINKKAVFSLTASNYQSGNLGGVNPDPVYYSGLFTKGENDSVSIGVATMDTGNASKIRYTKLGYSVVTALPDDMKMPEASNALFADPNYTFNYADGSTLLPQGATHWLKDPTGATTYLTSDAQGDFVINYTLERVNDNAGGCSTLDIYFPSGQFSFFVQRNGNQTCLNMGGFTFNIDYDEYAYMGAPVTISVAYSSNDGLFHVLLGGKHYTLQATNIAGTQYETLLWAQNAKILGFGCAYAASVVSDISYSVTKAEVDGTLSTWGTATNLTV